MTPAQTPAQTTATPAQAPKTLTCGPENVAEFNAALRTHAPEAFEMAKALHTAGLMNGLRGARLAIGGTLPRGNAISLAQMQIGPWNSPERGRVGK